MADKKTDLAIIIEAVNNASKQLNQVEKDLGGLNSAVKKQGEAAGIASLGFSKLVAGIATGHIIATVAIGIFKKFTSILADLPGIFFDIAKGAGEVNQTGIGMLIVANNAGIMGEEVLKVRDKIVDMNVTTKSANTLLRDLIRSEIDYTKATELVAATQNIASATGHSTSEAIERVSHAISSGIPWVLRDLGIKEDLNSVYERYAVSIDKSTEALTQAEKRTAIMNLVLREGEKYVGAYEASMKSSAKIMGQTRDRIKEISYNLGNVFEPALAEGAKAVKEFVEIIVKWAHENREKLMGIAKRISEFVKKAVEAIRNFVKSIPWDIVIEAFNSIIRKVIDFGNGLRIVSNIIQLFVRGLMVSINTVKALGKALSALARGDFKGLKQVYVDWVDYSANAGDAIMGDISDIGNAIKSSQSAQSIDLKEWWRNIEGIDSDGWEDRLKEAEEGGEQLTAKQRTKLKKMLDDIKKANRDYQRAVEERVKGFNESFDDLVLSHRDKIKDLTDDLEEENKEYKEKIGDLVEDYNDAMEAIEKRHSDKTDSLMEDMEEERKKAEEEIGKITEAHNEEVSLIEREGADRLSNLKAQLDQELALGANADQEKIDALEEMIAYEKEGLASSLDDKKDKHDEEVADIVEKLQEKLDKIQKELDEENQAYADSLAERKKQYDEDVADAKESYEEKRLALQLELDKELEIRNKYADDFARLADAIAEDDLSRLVRKHGEELAEMQRDHEEKIIEIKSKGLDQGSDYIGGLTEGIESGYPQFKNEIDKISSDIDSVTSKASGLGELGFNLGSLGVGSVAPEWNSSGGGGGVWARGGLASRPGIVGEAGPEIVLPLNFPKRMAQIMQAMGMRGSGGGEVNQNFYVTVKNSQDVDVLMERAGFAMKQKGGY